MLEKQIINDFKHITTLIHDARKRTFQKVNSELLQLYWCVGKYISEKIKSANWGSAIVDKLVEYIKQNEPEIKGFNRRNLFRMREFYETYTDNSKVSTLWTQLSWSHHRHILSKTKTIEEKEFYILLAIREKYSVRELERIIDSAYFERYMMSKNSASLELPEQYSNINQHK